MHRKQVLVAVAFLAVAGFVFILAEGPRRIYAGGSSPFSSSRCCSGPSGPSGTARIVAAESAVGSRPDRVRRWP